jgi:hypothetical protein
MKGRKLAILMFVLINMLFVDKYGARITGWHAIVSGTYALVTVGVLWILEHLIHKIAHPGRWVTCIAILMLTAAIGLQYTIDPIAIQVDRWSAIHNFLQGMLQGEYPYGQQTHLGGYGSPLPIWQILHLPFYAMGNVGLSIIVVLGLLIYTLYKTRGATCALMITCMLIISPALWYEIAVRSDLITNIMLVAILVEWLVHYRITLNEHTICIAILAGLLLSTRLVAIIPLAVLYGYDFLKIGWKRQVLFIVISLGTFVLTILPFVFWEGSTLLFFEYNPFVLQTRQGSPLALIIWLILAVGITLYLKDQQNSRTITTAGLLTALVVIAFVGKMWTENAWNELYTSTFDITYLSLGLPFYALHIAARRF